MAYRSRARSTGRARSSSGSYRRTSSSRGRRSTARRSSPARRSAPQRIEIVVVPGTPVTRPEFVGKKAAPEPTKRKL